MVGAPVAGLVVRFQRVRVEYLTQRATKELPEGGGAGRWHRECTGSFRPDGAARQPEGHSPHVGRFGLVAGARPADVHHG